MRLFILKRPIIFILLLNFIFMLFAIFTIKNDMYYLFFFWAFAWILNRKLLDYCKSDHENSKLEVIVIWIVILCLVIILSYDFYNLHIKEN